MGAPSLTVTSAPPPPPSRKRLIIQLGLAFFFGFTVMTIMGFDDGLFRWTDNCSTDVRQCAKNTLVVEDSFVTSESTTIQAEAKKAERKYPYAIVTASSANHLCSLENFLYSLHQLRSEFEPDTFPRVVVYNIGMNRTQLPVLDQLQRHGLIDDLVTFDYFKYPRFWDVAINAGEYAWKTGIVREAAHTYGGVLVWLDAGNMVTADFLRNIPSRVRAQHGFWSPRSSYRMGRWTHPGMFKYYHERPADYAKFPNCNGAAVGFDANNATIMDTLIEPWYQCGLDKRCIAPPGSSRVNHRQDQAALTYLVYKHGHKCTLNPERYDGLQIHRDVACRANLLELDVQNKLNHPSAVDFPKWQRSDTLRLYNHPEWRYHEGTVPEHIQQFVHSFT